MSGEVDTTRPLLSLILLGIVDFCCILIGLEQISIQKITNGIVWILIGVGSGAIGYYWQQIKWKIGGWLVGGGDWLQGKSKTAAAVTEDTTQLELEQSKVSTGIEAIRFVFVVIISLRVDENRVSRGKTLKIRYVVNSSDDVAGDIWLGASLWDANKKQFSNVHQDKSVSLLKGTHEYDRDLTIPTDALLGKRSLGANVWHGVVGDSAKSVIVAKGERIAIEIVA